MPGIRPRALLLSRGGPLAQGVADISRGEALKVPASPVRSAAGIIRHLGARRFTRGSATSLGKRRLSGEAALLLREWMLLRDPPAHGLCRRGWLCRRAFKAGRVGKAGSHKLQPGHPKRDRRTSAVGGLTASWGEMPRCACRDEGGIRRGIPSDPARDPRPCESRDSRTPLHAEAAAAPSAASAARWGLSVLPTGSLRLRVVAGGDDPPGPAFGGVEGRANRPIPCGIHTPIPPGPWPTADGGSGGSLAGWHRSRGGSRAP
jgi:hypothetical protein